VKLLLVHERFPPDFRGGGEYVVGETARHLHDQGIDVQVLTTGDPRQDCHAGIPVRRLPIHPYRLLGRTRDIVAAARGADLIQTYTYHGCLPSWRAARRLDLPVVCTVLGLFGDAWSAMRGPLTGRLYQRWERHLVGLPYDRTIFLSDFSRDLGLTMGVDAKRSAIINPGIALEDYAPAETKDPTALFVGKFDVRKGVDEILALARAMPELHVQMFGWGPEEARLWATSPPNLEIIPFQRGAPLREVFARARMLLLPSRAETFGLVLIEAMASGCAVVSSIPLDYAGVTVRPGDTEGFIAAVRTLWEDPQRLEALGQENLRRSKRYSWANAIGAQIDLYDEVLRTRHRTGA
jgi:glycosyltransferase involved in cell wall biosynthesis